MVASAAMLGVGSRVTADIAAAGRFAVIGVAADGFHNLGGKRLAGIGGAWIGRGRWVIGIGIRNRVILVARCNKEAQDQTEACR